MTIIKKFEPEVEKEKFPKRNITLVGLFLGVLVIVEIWVSHTLVGYGEEFKNMENLKKTLSSENQFLENEIAKYSALSNVASKSAALGFTKPKKVQYIR